MGTQVRHSFRTVSGDALSNRLKFVVRPVKADPMRKFAKTAVCIFGASPSGQVPLPVPAKSPKDAEYVGPYFGDGAYVDACLSIIS